MTLPFTQAALAAARSPQPLLTTRDPNRLAANLFAAAERLEAGLCGGPSIDANALRAAMELAFGASDADGAWVWKDAYEAMEIAEVLFLRRHGPAMLEKALGSPRAMLVMLSRLAGCLPTQTRRSEESEAYQQFSTPIELGFVASVAGRMSSSDLVLEPSAGTGLLAIFAELAGAPLHLNELAAVRASVLSAAFPGVSVTRHNGEHIHDHLEPSIRPTVMLMNPPFSVSPQVDVRVTGAAGKHIVSAFARLAVGGRLVAITPPSLDLDTPKWRETFAMIGPAHVVFSAIVSGKAYARHGTQVETRLTVIDKSTGPNFDRSRGALIIAQSAGDLLAAVERDVTPRASTGEAATPHKPASAIGRGLAVTGRPTRSALKSSSALAPDLDTTVATELRYDVTDASQGGGAARGGALYELYRLQRICIPGARSHPTPLVQSAAMASIAPPAPSYRPHLPRRALLDGLLSDAQLESVIYAGEAHQNLLSGWFTVNDSFDKLTPAAEGSEGAIRFRRGWFLGDGTGAGKGRQAASIIADNWIKGHRKAVWISKSDKLIEDARRDWAAIGGEPLQIAPLSRFSQGTDIRINDGILFTTYATLRTGAARNKPSRLAQILKWIGPDFDGVIIFDEAHAMANAAGSSGERGDKAPSQQGLAGLRLQNACPHARIVYISATGATTVQNLAYASRLGLWGTGDVPFATRVDFVAALEAGGVAAQEVLARDLKALGLYAARSLSYHGVEVRMLEHALTAEQIRIYDAYADAFQIIHNNLEAALKAANITGAAGKALNAHAKAAARSAFESNKQRFFNHLIMAMKTPSLIASIRRDLENGDAAIIQIVSTNEALLERRLAHIPAGEWGDLSIDITPREYVLDYLAHAFPVQLYETYTDENGNLLSRPVVDSDGHPVQCRAALDLRDAMIERLASLPPVPGALDQIIQHFGTDAVAEVTGRSRRIVKQIDGAQERMSIETRPASANLSEAQAFMDDTKRILVFSDAGGTGRSYHADLGAKNQRRRIHYLLEAGWRADTAIQGLGRSNRTNQRQPPVFRPVTTDVKAEKRFLSTIARRLDTLGAITRGARATGGQGLFRAEDNLESAYARAALRDFFHHVQAGQVEACSAAQFEAATGLTFTHDGGGLKDELPPISQFLNRMLALRIDLQNRLFEVFEGLVEERIEAAMAAGIYEQGVETITAERLRVAERQTLFTHAATGAKTTLVAINRRQRTKILGVEDALELGSGSSSRLLINASSGRAAVSTSAPSALDEGGGVIARARLHRPKGRDTVTVDALAQSEWRASDASAFRKAWDDEIETIPPFTDDTIHLITGLLLPIWDRLGHGKNAMRVYRLETDDGERLIGRVIAADILEHVLREFGIGVSASPMVPTAAFSSVLRHGQSLRLQRDFILRRSLVMGAYRIELTGFSDTAVPQLKALGLISEIIAWKLRLFVPAGEDNGPAVLERLFERWPVRHFSNQANAA
ncbi:MAG: strawberry notch family protein [Hyphomicrobiales bacterium]|nr:strawberry notch family protein [Hyphomicrobiales bacterium]